MNTNLSFNQSSPEIKPRTKAYIPVKYKFIIGHIVAFLWLCFSVYVSVPWVFDLAHLVSFPLSVVIIAGLAYIPRIFDRFFGC